MRFSLLATTSLTGASAAKGLYPGFSQIQDIFIFGDSYSKTGFDPSGTQPSSSNPLGNPSSVGRATSANGPNYVEYLTQMFNQSSVLTYNFGTGGATLNSSVVDSKFSLLDELNDYYLPIYTRDEDAATWANDTILFIVWVGINDINRSYLDEDPDMNPLIVDNYRRFVDTLYDTGARNFLLLNVPPLEKTPTVLQDEKTPNRATLEKAAVEDYNERLLGLVEEVEASYADVTVFHYDTHSLFNQVIEDPAQFEWTADYKTVTESCAAYEDGSAIGRTKYDACDYAVNEYMWRDKFHVTWPIHKLLAEELAGVLSS
ncbi:hypothetical protein FE257_009862 [Aspergillus nanangensis]|uniref:Uncharacterized protein n=1 Tax=Aspergillus nanangensis TaxID=2582783 RepID=A0AAD4CVX7_ASPNN|nr:hypothetical protein FE257_009862 [Aspergillus nanangensis]